MKVSGGFGKWYVEWDVILSGKDLPEEFAEARLKVAVGPFWFKREALASGMFATTRLRMKGKP